MNALLEKVRFIPQIDIPLSAVVAVVFMLGNYFWARDKNVDTDIDLLEKLPMAQVKVVLLIGLMLGFAWFSNLGLWAFCMFLLTVGCIFSFAAGLGDDESMIVLASIAFLIRDWAFGFPLMRLHSNEDINDLNEVLDSMVGMKGIAVSPLRPYGDVKIDGKVHPAVSENGMMMETESQVIVVGKRAGTLAVKIEGVVDA